MRYSKITVITLLLSGLLYAPLCYANPGSIKVQELPPVNGAKDSVPSPLAKESTVPSRQVPDFSPSSNIRNDDPDVLALDKPLDKKNLPDALQNTQDNLLPEESEITTETAAPAIEEVLPLEEEENFPVNENDDVSGEGDEQENIAPGTVDSSSSTKPAATDAAKSPAVIQEAPKNYRDTVILQGLNKITARISTLESSVGSSVRFGNLEIFVRLCWRSPPEETPDSKALLEIWEQKPGEDRAMIFNGWMFASSPALSALEHPVYDITVIECKLGSR